MGRKLIIDTDPGVDDAFALALAARSTEVDLVGVTTVFGNVPLEATTENARRLLNRFGRADVPVAAGAERPLVHAQSRSSSVHGADGLSGRSASLAAAERELETADAVSMLVSLLERTDEPVTIAPIGPLTNIALLLAAHPRIRDRIERLVIMGGAIGRGNITAAAEFNVWADPEAARRVLVEERVPVTLVPMDLTRRCAVSTDWLAELAEGNAIGEVLVSLTGDYLDHYRKELGYDGIVLHDAVAVAEAIRPGILETERFPVDVDCSFGPYRGATLLDQRRWTHREANGEPDGPSIEVAVDTDLDGLRKFVLDGIRG
ncbi:nucleoside hydrolase [Amycolatopsis magusensis]|uniref:Pyrimidine-specific ribonucleoside hydrolase n=1 Tax=Amycolatopsis magusensis TaxID=882444 RepID=A0ABS4Q5C0_9PSEU|nr:nucleoside hydrolase [Amycolatopsis magusensis]MBP2186793.1 pyrimidine-specific ribonucleoside hydrolase [Amycolatopsis magusensis]MDI5980425.1 nucleoside hydrolase [Amycolatopsis magusensis]